MENHQNHNIGTATYAFPTDQPASPCHYCGSKTGPRAFAYDATGGPHLACYPCQSKHHDRKYKPNTCPGCGSHASSGPCPLCGTR